MSLLSVVIPSFNEELNILHTAETVARVLEDNHIDYEIIFVDDGSKDDTYNKIREAGAKTPKVRGAKFSRNFGKESCIFAGLSLATGDCCVVMDCDLQHPADVVPRMYKLWKEGYDVIEGVKKSRGKESIAHKMSAGLFYKLISRCSGIDMERSSDFKLLDRKVVDTLLTLQERNTFFRALSFWVGFRAITIEFEVAEREFGTTKWSIKSLAKYAINNVTSFSATVILNYWLRRHFYSLLLSIGYTNFSNVFVRKSSSRIYYGYIIVINCWRDNHGKLRNYRILYCENL
ncbi:MAG: glycosyltransferase family 2 protein [Lachnospiraceae bacterium]